MQEIDPLKLKQYVKSEIEYRIKIKKKELRQKKKFQSYFNNLKEENADLKEEIESLKAKNVQLEKINSQYKAEIEYMNIKNCMTRKNRDNNSSQNTSMLY